MFTKLEQLVQRYEELNSSLSDPKTIADNRLFQKLGKERSDLQELVEAYTRYKEIQKQLKENKEILEQENDPQMREMAKEEFVELEKKLQELEANLKILLLPKDPNDDKNIYLEIRAGTGGAGTPAAT